MPSNTLPSTMNTTIEIARKPAAPPGTLAIESASDFANPACVKAHAIAVADPMISRIAPDSDAVSTNIGNTRRNSKRR